MSFKNKDKKSYINYLIEHINLIEKLTKDSRETIFNQLEIDDD